jgi:hypothetical protein
MAKQVIVKFDENGDPTVDLDGFQGKGCKAVAKAFSEALGRVVESKDKPELYRESNTTSLVNR